MNDLRDIIDTISSMELKSHDKLKELVGHTRLEVIMGVIIAVIGYILFLKV